jgi:4-alpha-glucanotransferase
MSHPSQVASAQEPATPFRVQERRAGVLLPVSSLPSRGPIGDLDGAAPFIDWLAEAGMGIWQILPLGPTDIYGSPYSSWSTFSGSPDFVGVQWCIDAGLLPESTLLETTPEVDYAETISWKRPLILRAAQGLLDDPTHPWTEALETFVEGAPWATDCALYYALKCAYDDAPWWTWPEPIKRREPQALERALSDLTAQVETWRTALFLFERQWSEIRAYARSRDVQIVGDMPIYVGAQSVDVWTHQELFQLTASGEPERVAGVPPDAYSDTGQLWGNPLFHWEACAREGYGWWIDRAARALEMCDALRVDHFIGFTRYWAVDSGSEDATNGTWNPGPGRPLFDALVQALGGLALIAEDLGLVDDATLALRDELGLPGMRVIQFGLGPDAEAAHQVDAHVPLSVVYTGTHDSPTVRGWWEGLSSQAQGQVGLGEVAQEVVVAAIELALSSRSFWAVIPAQDLLGLGEDARMNQPGTLGGNWVWRLPDAGMGSELARWVRARLWATDRLNVRDPGTTDPDQGAV